jgi:hypothetical protein
VENSRLRPDIHCHDVLNFPNPELSTEFMNETLLEQFVLEECTDYVRDLVRTALDAGASGAGPRRKKFEFNRFEVTFDLDEDIVFIEDAFDTTNTGAQRLLLSELLTALEKSLDIRSEHERTPGGDKR